jgi:hypothetical protein
MINIISSALVAEEEEPDTREIEKIKDGKRKQKEREEKERKRWEKEQERNAPKKP